MNMHRQIALMMQPAAGEPPVVADPVFWANTYDLDTFEMLGVRTGVGGLTEARAYQIEVSDYDGVYRTFEGGEPAWQGGRVAKNYCGRSTSLSGFDTNDVRTWVATASMTVLDFETVEATARYASIGVEIPTAVGELLIVSFEAMNIDGNTNLWVAAGDRYSFDLTDQWQRFSVVFLNPVATQSILIQDRLPDSWGRFKIRNLMVEYTGAVATVCSEFVPFIGSVSPDWIKVFSNYNGNTVTERVVTEAVGAPLPEVPRLVYAPQATNEIFYSRDLTSRDGSEYTWTTTGSLVITVDQIGLRGDANGASLLTKDTTPNTYTEITTVPGSSGRDFGVKLYFRQEAMDGDYAGVKIALGDTGGDRRIYAINKETGAHSVISEVNNPFTYEHSEIVGNEVVFTVGGNLLSTTKIYIAIYGAVSKDFATVDTSALGNITVMNVEVYMDATADAVKDFPPLINDTAATVTRDACDLQFDIANHDNAQGAWMVEAEVLSPVSAAMALLGFRSASPSIINPLDGNTAVRSTNDAFFTEITGLDVTLAKKFAVAYDAAADKMVLVVDGFDSTVVSYSEFIVSSDIRLAYNSEEAIRFGQIMRYDAPYDQAKQIIDSWMAE